MIDGRVLKGKNRTGSLFWGQKLKAQEWELDKKLGVRRGGRDRSDFQFNRD